MSLKEEIQAIRVELAELRQLVKDHCDLHKEKGAWWEFLLKWGTLIVAVAALARQL